MPALQLDFATLMRAQQGLGVAEAGVLADVLSHCKAAYLVTVEARPLWATLCATNDECPAEQYCFEPIRHCEAVFDLRAG